MPDIIDPNGFLPRYYQLANILREDVVQPSLSVDEALTNAPERSDTGHFVVPAILGGGGGA